MLYVKLALPCDEHDVLNPESHDALSHMMCGAHGLKEFEDGSLERPCAVGRCGKLIPAKTL